MHYKHIVLWLMAHRTWKKTTRVTFPSQVPWIVINIVIQMLVLHKLQQYLTQLNTMYLIVDAVGMYRQTSMSLWRVNIRCPTISGYIMTNMIGSLEVGRVSDIKCPCSDANSCLSLSTRVHSIVISTGRHLQIIALIMKM